MKTCTKCFIEQPLSAYSKHLSALRNICRACQSEARKAHYAANREREVAANKRWHEENRKDVLARQAEWRKANAATVEAYRQRTKAEACARTVKRYADKCQATPKWSDLKAIKAVYAEAKFLRDLGVDVHVDHIVPLKCKEACGLHVPANLQLMYGPENRSKGNRLDERARGG